MEKKYEQWFYNNFYDPYDIGDGTRIGSFCDIGGIIGENCNIQSFAFIPRGVIIEDNVFIGPRVTFLNDKYPPSDSLEETIVGEGAVIGGGCIILPGIVIGENVFVGAGSLVTKSIPANEKWRGSPAEKYE